MKPIIEVKDIAKRYHISSAQKEGESGSLKRSLHNLLTGKWRYHSWEEFWALQDLNFSLFPGEVVSILGHNGSGKSTLLKLMSRIIEPTCGTITLYGRLGALLEIGTGMHAELTGRENIFFCGALLGMNKQQIHRHLEAIIAFADIEAFLDTPFKKYSSGMALRLAASVLLHLNTDILILDEILSAGDYAFQSMCFDKIQQVAREGRLVLCVTHHEEWITSYCHRALLLSHGRLVADGAPSLILEEYHASNPAGKQGNGSAHTVDKKTI